MNLIFNNQFSIFEDIFYKYLTPKQCTKLYTSNIILYNIYVDNNKFESNYFTPKTGAELREAVNLWCDNRDKAILLYRDIEYWNTIYITSMNLLFWNKVNFNDNISDWNTSNVNTMKYTFCNAYLFNQPIGNWDISNVINMMYMFCGARNFNQSIYHWNIYDISNTKNMFKDCNTNIDNIII